MVPILKDKFGFKAAQMKEVKSYNSHIRAQAAAILCEIFQCGLKDIVHLQDLPGHEELTLRLMEGMLSNG